MQRKPPNEFRAVHYQEWSARNYKTARTIYDDRLPYTYTKGDFSFKKTIDFQKAAASHAARSRMYMGVYDDDMTT